MKQIIYECGICDCYHPWNWDGDCREDKNRFGSPSEYAEEQQIADTDVEVRSWEERNAD